MSRARADRREFLRSSLATAGMAALGPRLASAAEAAPAVEAAKPAANEPARPPRIRFAVIGINHSHVHRQIEAVERGGGELVSFFAKEPDLAEAFAKRYPKCKQARSEKEILESDV